MKDKTLLAHNKAERKAQEDFFTNKMLVSFGVTVVAIIALMFFRNFVNTHLYVREGTLKLVYIILYSLFGLAFAYGIARFFIARKNDTPESKRVISGYNICTIAVTGLFCVAFMHMLPAMAFRWLFVFLLIVGIISVINYIMVKEFYYTALILSFGGMGMYFLQRMRNSAFMNRSNFLNARLLLPSILIGVIFGLAATVFFGYLWIKKGRLGKNGRQFVSAGFSFWQPVVAGIVVLVGCLVGLFIGANLLLHGAVVCAVLLFLAGVYNAVRMI